MLFIRRLSVWFFGTNRHEERAVKRINPPQQGAERMFLYVNLEHDSDFAQIWD